MPKFKPGDKVVWSHHHGSVHGDGSVLKKSAALATNPVGNDLVFGEVVAAANAPQTWFDVALENGAVKTLTGDELVLVSEE